MINELSKHRGREINSIWNTRQWLSDLDPIKHILSNFQMTTERIPSSDNLRRKFDNELQKFDDKTVRGLYQLYWYDKVMIFLGVLVMKY